MVHFIIDFVILGMQEQRSGKDEEGDDGPAHPGPAQASPAQNFQIMKIKKRVWGKYINLLRNKMFDFGWHMMCV